MGSAGYEAYQKLRGVGVNGTGSLQEANAAIDQLKQTYSDLETRVQGLNYQLSAAWEGSASDAALQATTPFVKTLQDMQDNMALHHLGTNDQTGQFGHSAGQMMEIPPNAPSNNLLNEVTPWHTDLDQQIGDYNNADTHNQNVLTDYQNTTHNNVTKLPSDYQQLTTDSMPNVQATGPQSTPGGGPMGGVPRPGAPSGGGPAGAGGAAPPGASPPGVPGATSSQGYQGAPSTPGGSYGDYGANPLAASGGYGTSSGYGGNAAFAPLGGTGGYGGGGGGGYGSGRSSGGYGGGAPGGASGNAPGRGAMSGASEANPAASAASAASEASAARSSSTPGGMGGPMGGARGRGGEDSEHKSASYLVDQDHGNAIIGELPKTVPPVIGG